MDAIQKKATCNICLLTPSMRDCQTCNFQNPNSLLKFRVTFINGSVQSEIINAKYQAEVEDIYSGYEIMAIETPEEAMFNMFYPPATLTNNEVNAEIIEGKRLADEAIYNMRQPAHRTDEMTAAYDVTPTPSDMPVINFDDVKEIEW